MWVGLLEGDEIRCAVEDLVADIKSRDYHLATGFVGTPFLYFVLSDYGYPDVAYRLLIQETSPGWLYQIKCGATSIWERWDALREDGTVKDDGDVETNIVSFNHYAYGAIGDWLYRRVAGLEALEAGYRTFAVRPVIGGGLTHVRLSYICSYGDIIIGKINGNMFWLSLQVPAGTIASVTLPNGETWQVGAGNHSFTQLLQ